ncbi:methylamine utilization protein [Sphingomonas sp. JC676]|uniref:methylamine utilization protein n=1 Tax=Sphingomonas sp. JC676 TaxID=2768065 RepID=UPI0016583DE1|nr:methylamine utilization protein [Sphingomonas sp. JC676]MBC9032244.1 methylamine utilization protein [Sphingomonas sp. JC676]
MRFPIVLAALLTIGAVSPLPAATGVTVYVRGPGNAPIADAVVTVHLIGRPTPAASAAGSYTVNQKDIQFHPFVLMVPVGSEVSFPNLDPVRHHVYSFSPAKKFELKLYAKEQNRAVTFDKPGIVALGCNIHDQMSAYIDVVDTTYAVKTDASGNAVFNGVPAGQISIEVWHPYLRAPGSMIRKQVTLAAAGTAETIAVTLRAPPRMTGSSHY